MQLFSFTFHITLLFFTLTVLAFPSSNSLTSSQAAKRSFKLPLTRRVEPVATIGLSSSTNVNITQQIRHWQTVVSIGNQEVSLSIDTGSADTWVYGPEVSNLGSHTPYDCSKSPTCWGMTETLKFDIKYVYGFGASGSVVYDTVTIGNTTVALMAVDVADNVGIYADYPPDGFLGLGWGKLNQVKPKPQRTFMEMVKDDLIDPVFAVDLSSSKPNGSTIEFGAIDYSRGPFSKANIDNWSGHWQVNDISFEVQGVRVRQNQTMMFDTGGSSYMDVSQPIVDAFYKSVKGAYDRSGKGDGVFPCGEKVPDLKMYIGNGTATIPWRSIHRWYDPNIHARFTCQGYLRASQAGTSYAGNVAGPFFESHYVVFDQGDRPAVMWAAA